MLARPSSDAAADPVCRNDPAQAVRALDSPWGAMTREFMVGCEICSPNVKSMQINTSQPYCGS